MILELGTTSTLLVDDVSCAHVVTGPMFFLLSLLVMLNVATRYMICFFTRSLRCFEIFTGYLIGFMSGYGLLTFVQYLGSAVVLAFFFMFLL